MSVQLNNRDSIINAYITLYVLERGRGRIDGITKLQKIVFLAQNELTRRGLRAFSGEFFKYNHGPMSKEVYYSHDMLVDNDLITDPGLKLTDHGTETIEEFKQIIEDNPEIFRTIDKIVDRFAKLSLRQLKEHVYCIEIKPVLADKEQKISEIEPNTTILRNYTADSFDISDEDLDTLEIYLDGEFYQSLCDSIDSVKKGKLHRFEEVFGAE